MTSPLSLRKAGALLIASGAAALTLGIAAMPAAAGTAATQYTATLAQPVSDARVVAGKTLWKCAGTECAAVVEGSRAGRVCRDLQRKAGTVTQFTVAGQPLDAEALSRCNA
ncbi:hypothetical protein [Porphyrobacter sp. GA68]|uniref:CC_3452 family protein n=1 Tax=Porphyrobacter sp. GA68 TaxID=2883480 RepID=UPI001D187C23|nr:hypothetical protein [Porphyrobacter sp. GA68]